MGTERDVHRTGPGPPSEPRESKSEARPAPAKRESRGAASSRKPRPLVLRCPSSPPPPAMVERRRGAGAGVGSAASSSMRSSSSGSKSTASTSALVTAAIAAAAAAAAVGETRVWGFAGLRLARCKGRIFFLKKDPSLVLYSTKHKHILIPVCFCPLYFFSLFFSVWWWGIWIVFILDPQLPRQMYSLWFSVLFK